jgi:hypothetical protein
MDETKLRSALAMLQAIADKMPDGDIEEKYVELYNKALTELHNQLTQFGCDLSSFFIPQGELERHVASFRYGPRLPRHRNQPDVTYTNERYCDRSRFEIALHGAMKLISGYLQAPSPVKPKIGF